LIALAAWQALSLREVLPKVVRGPTDYHGSCVYLVVRNDVELGTAFLHKPTSFTGVLRALHIKAPQWADRERLLPCGSVIKYETRGSGLLICRLKGNLILLSEQRVDLNEACRDSLEAVPGIGPELADGIVRFRNMRRHFKKLEDLSDIPGIGEGKILQIKPFVIVRSSNDRR
jgi:competence ComEA-like helix-hairpin-helix protein